MSDPFTTVLCGGSRRTEIAVASLYTGGITVPGTNGRNSANLSAQESISSCEPMQGTLFSFGETTSTTQSRLRKGSNARFSVTKALTSRPSLSDRLTPSLMSLGLVAGTTPKLIRRLSGAAIQDFASLPLVGGAAASRKTANSFLSGRHEAEAPHA